MRGPTTRSRTASPSASAASGESKTLSGARELGLALPQHIGADDAQRALGAGDADVELERRVHPRDARQARDAR